MKKRSDESTEKLLSPKEQIARYYQEGKTEILSPQKPSDGEGLTYREVLRISRLQIVHFPQILKLDNK